MTRYHELDALRAFAMMLGIVLHTSLFLIPAEQYVAQDAWLKTVTNATNPYAYGAAIIHGFRMPVFFMISGFFTAMLWRSRGLTALIRNRCARIALPLLVCMFTVIPAIEWIVQGQAFDPASWPVVWLSRLWHLWFLLYLLLVGAAFAIAVRLGLTFHHRAWLLLIPASLAFQLLMQQTVFGPDLPETTLPPAHLLGYYATFFAFGAFIHERRVELRRWWSVALLPGLLVAFPVGATLLFPEGSGIQKQAWFPAASDVFQITYTWLMCFGLIGLFRCFAATERAWVRYLSDASYWLYICHLPLVMIGQVLLVEQPVSVHLKFLLICAAVVAVLLLSYRFGVRYTLIGTTLNGRRLRHQE